MVPHRLPAVLLLSALQLASMTARGQDKRAIPSPSADHATGEQAEAARRSSDEAQAEYYREQTKALRRGVPQKTLWQNISDNPTSVMGVVAALIVALVTLTSFLLNYRVSLNNQMDTQFYEALTRFGNKDSVALRATAAGILAQMAKTERRNFSWRRPIKSVRIRERTYFVTARNQLITGLLLEEDDVALFSIRDALHLVVSIYPEAGLEMVFRVNQFAFGSAMFALAKFFVACGAKEDAKISSEQLSEAAFLGAFETDSLANLIEKQRELFQSAMRSQVLAFEVVPLDKRGEHLIESRQLVRKTLFRLRLLVHVYSRAFKNNSLASFTKRYGPLFLVAADLRRANLEGCALSEANLWRADLREANLANVNLSGASLGNAKLGDSRLAGAKISSRTDFSGSNWWAADFFTREGESIDNALISELHSRYPVALANNVADLHPSTRLFFEKTSKNPNG